MTGQMMEWEGLHCDASEGGRMNRPGKSFIQYIYVLWFCLFYF